MCHAHMPHPHQVVEQYLLIGGDSTGTLEGEGDTHPRDTPTEDTPTDDAGGVTLGEKMRAMDFNSWHTLLGHTFSSLLDYLRCVEVRDCHVITAQ